MNGSKVHLQDFTFLENNFHLPDNLEGTYIIKVIAYEKTYSKKVYMSI